jgi:sec-independent protein translocase protein TatA
MGFAELLVVLFLVLLFFGARRLPAMGEGLGRAIRGFKDSMRSEPPPQAPQAPQAPPPKKELPPPGGGTT